MTAAVFDPSQMLGVIKFCPKSQRAIANPNGSDRTRIQSIVPSTIEAWLHKQYPDGVPVSVTVGRNFKSR